MSPLRFLNRALPSGDVVLRGVEAVDRPGSGPDGLQDGTTLYELRVTGPGLVVAPVGGPVQAVPDLVPWSSVCSLTARGPLSRSDAARGQILEMDIADGGWFDGDRVQRFVAPTAGVPAFVLAASSHHPLTSAEPDGSSDVPAMEAHTAHRLRGTLHRWASGWTRAGGERSGRHATHVRDHRRLGPVVLGVLALVFLAGSSTTFGAGAGAGAGASAPVGGPIHGVGNRLQALKQNHSPALAPATAKPRPAPPSLAASPRLESHEVFGYAPYWTLPQSSRFDVQDLTTLAYFSVDANPDGTLDESGAGWNGYESQDLVTLVNRAHAAGDRVVLTVTDFSQSSLDTITSDPRAGTRLSAALIAAVAAKNLDGVNFDFEGEGSGDRAGLTRLITQVSHALHAANPDWQVTMATYASAAGDSGGFYNIAALAPAVDGFFVMAYDMNDSRSPSATAPLVGGGFNDTEALDQFTAVVPPQKVILGVPFYGYDWPTTNGTGTARATGPESPLSDSVIEASGHPTYWDPSTQTAWTSYKVGNQWHETYFDNPTSLALKARLANSFHIAGVGIWALGMDGDNPAMMAALLGDAPAAKDELFGPTTTTDAVGTPTSTTAPPGTGYVTSAVWKGSRVVLKPRAPLTSDGNAQYLGTLSQFTTTDPTLSCLGSGPAVEVWTFSTLPGVDVAVTSQPQDCATALWTFRPARPPSAGPGRKKASPTTTTEPPTTTTSTTVPPTSTTTTSTTVPPTSTTTTTTTSTTVVPATTPSPTTTLTG